MSEPTQCATHALATGPDGLCVLCKRASSAGHIVVEPLAATTSTRMGIVVLGAVVGMMVAIAGLYGWSTSDAEVVAPSLEPEPETFEIRELSAAAEDMDTEELARLAKAEFWQQPTEPVPRDDPGVAEAPPPSPDVAPQTSQVLTPEQRAADAAREREEAERDRRRHAEIEADMARRAKQQALDREQALVSEARAKVRIDLYGADWCKSCRKARAYLSAEGIRYTDHDVDAESGARETMRQLNPRHTIPTIRIDDEVVVGFSERSFDRAVDRAARKRAGVP